MSKVKTPEMITVNVGGTPRHLKMSYGLLTVLTQILGDLEAVAELSFDADLRSAVLGEILAERDEFGAIVSPVNLFMMEIDADDVVEILDWAGAHVADFLLKQMTRSQALLKGRQAQIAALMPTSSGLET